MANGKQKGGLNVGNILIAAGVGFGVDLGLNKLDEKVAWFGENKWAGGLGAALIGAGVEYFTEGKYPQFTYPLIAVGSARLGESVMNSMNGFSYVPAGDKQQQMQGLLDDIKKYRDVQMAMGNNLPNYNAPGGSRAANPMQEAFPELVGC